MVLDALLGRPVYDFVNCFLTDTLVATPADGYKVRLIGIAMLCLCAAYLCRLMTRRGISLPYSVLLSSAIFSLPGWQVLINYTGAVAFIVAAPLIVVAFHVLLRERWRMASKVAVAALLLVVAALASQQITPLFFVFIAIAVLLDDDPDRARRLLAGGVVAFGLAGVAYLAIHSFVLVPYVSMLWDCPLSKFIQNLCRSQAIKFAPLLAAEHFFTNLPSVFALWFINFAHWLWLVLLAAFLLAAAALIVYPRGKGGARPVEVAVWLVLLLGLVNAVTVLSLEPDVQQHHNLPYEAFVAAIIALGAYRIVASRAVAVAFLVGGLAYSGWNMKRNVAEPNAAELAYIMTSIARYELGKSPQNMRRTLFIC